jgi:CheY-like chemotaxis protein
LINNAIKFSPEGTQVDVNILSANNELIVAVKDLGIGISNADQLKLFNKFQQVGKAKSSEGTGLGLSITKGLVELMKGKIKLTSAEGQGSLFKVTLPITANAILTDIKPAKALILSCNRESQILVVEDNVINQEVVKAQFASLGLRVQIAGTGEKALQMIEENDYELIFMDIHLPGISGIEATSLIKQNHANLPVVGLSADSFEQHNFLRDRNLAPSTEMSDYLLKPIDSQQLIAVLNRFLPNANELSEPS